MIPDITDSLIESNSAIQQGGGIWTDRTILTMSGSLILHNVVTAVSDAYGGGLLMVGSTAANVTTTTIARNSASTNNPAPAKAMRGSTHLNGPLNSVPAPHDTDRGPDAG